MVLFSDVRGSGVTFEGVWTPLRIFRSITGTEINDRDAFLPDKYYLTFLVNLELSSGFSGALETYARERKVRDGGKVFHPRKRTLLIKDACNRLVLGPLDPPETLSARAHARVYITDRKTARDPPTRTGPAVVSTPISACFFSSGRCS